MKYLKLTLNTQSGFSNLFTADQIWGHMVCAIANMKGDDAASKFVASFDSDPPFLLSNMFPEHFLPRASLPPFKRDSKENLSHEAEKKNRALAKKNKKNKWIPIETFVQYQKDLRKLSIAKVDASGQPKIQSINEVRSSIDRKTGAPFEKTGGLFNQTFLYSGDNFVIYIQLKDESAESKKLLSDIIAYLNLTGLGGDRNVGKGNFNIEIKELDAIEKQLFAYQEGNAFMTLSRCSGKNLEPLYYQISYYFGIVGSNRGERKTFNKYPVIYFEPGSVFLNGQGTILHHVHTDEKICSYGYSFPLFVNI